jgi:hypothetical protein
MTTTKALPLARKLGTLDDQYRFVRDRLLYRVGSEQPIGRIVPDGKLWVPELWRFSEFTDGYGWEQVTTGGVTKEHALKVLWFNRHGAGE